MKRRRETETMDFAKFALRIIRRWGVRVAMESEADLADLVEGRRVLDEAIDTAVAGLLAQGHSWQYIADGLGIPRQNAWRKYAHVGGAHLVVTDAQSSA